LLLQAAAEGNVDTLKLVLNAEGGDISKLTDSQREFVGAILSSDLYNALDDNAFLNDTLSKTKDHYAEQLAKMQVNFDLTNDVTAAEKLLSNGMFNETQFDALISNIKKSVRPDGITQEQANSLDSRLRQASGIGIVTQFSAGASSQELLDLKTFVDSKGEVRDGMTQATIKAGEEILKNVSSDKDISAVTSKLSGLKADVAEREKEKEAARVKLELQSTVVSGFGNSNDKSHRDIAQEMIDKAGLKISDFSTYDPQTQLEMIRLSTSAVPTDLVTELEKLASGQPVQGAESVMAMFMQINRAKGKPFGNAISDTTIAMLEDANSIVATLGGNFNDVVAKLREMRSDEKSNKYVQAELGEEKGKQKTLEQILLARYENDTLLAVEMKPVLEYYLRTQKTLDDALSRIDTIVDQRYAESEFIVDPRLPAGNKFRSRYALEAVFKDPNDRKQFIRTVESQLPSGYSLFHNQTQKAGGAAASVAMYESFGQPVPEELRQEAITQQRTKQVYLMPVEGTAYPEYYAYYVDENNELRPLIFERSVSEKQNELVWPMFGPDDIAAYVKINQLKRKNDLKAKAQEDQAWQDQLNKSTWEGYYGGIQKQAESVVK